MDYHKASLQEKFSSTGYTTVSECKLEMAVCIERSAQIILIFPEWMKFHVKSFTFIQTICTASEDCKAALLWGESCFQTQTDWTSAGVPIQGNKCRPTKAKLQIRLE